MAQIALQNDASTRISRWSGASDQLGVIFA
jgi:hypothetical protein